MNKIIKNHLQRIILRAMDVKDPSNITEMIEYEGTLLENAMIIDFANKITTDEAENKRIKELLESFDYERI